MAETGRPRVAVLGLGYVGLPLAAAFAQAGFSVVGYDRDEARVRRLAAAAAGGASVPDVPQAEVPSSPLGPVADGRLRLLADPSGLCGAEVFIIAVPTPVHDDRQPDLGPLLAACDAIGAAISRQVPASAPRPLVVVESTVAPGTTRDVVGPRVAAACGLVPERDFDLAVSPERVSPGDPARGLHAVPKVVAADTEAALDRALDLYRSALTAPLVPSRSTSAAELAKLLENTQRDLGIALVNQAARLASHLGQPAGEALRLAATKWNFQVFSPGLVGGHCIGVDPWYLAASFAEAGLDAGLIRAARAVHSDMPGWLAEHTLALVAAGPRSAGARRLVDVVGIFGASYKEDVSDLRNTGAAPLAACLRAAGAEVRLVDPHADPEQAARVLGQRLTAEADAVDLDALVLAAPHACWRPAHAKTLAVSRLYAHLRPGGVLVDVRGALAGTPVPHGFHYWHP